MVADQGREPNSDRVPIASERADAQMNRCKRRAVSGATRAVNGPQDNIGGWSTQSDGFRRNAIYKIVEHDRLHRNVPRQDQADVENSGSNRSGGRKPGPIEWLAQTAIAPQGQGTRRRARRGSAKTVGAKARVVEAEIDH